MNNPHDMKPTPSDQPLARPRRFLPGQPIRLHCWRGGMRSCSMAWLASSLELPVVLLDGERLVRAMENGSFHGGSWYGLYLRAGLLDRPAHRALKSAWSPVGTVAPTDAITAPTLLEKA